MLLDVERVVWRNATSNMYARTHQPPLGRLDADPLNELAFRGNPSRIAIATDGLELNNALTNSRGRAPCGDQTTVRSTTRQSSGLLVSAAAAAAVLPPSCRTWKLLSAETVRSHRCCLHHGGGGLGGVLPSIRTLAARRVRCGNSRGGPATSLLSERETDSRSKITHRRSFRTL